LTFSQILETFGMKIDEPKIIRRDDLLPDLSQILPGLDPLIRRQVEAQFGLITLRPPVD
jgi:hypothetical protein